MFDFNKYLKTIGFGCGHCHSTNIRVKDVTEGGEAEDIGDIVITVCCNECDEEWTEHFALDYIGWRDGQGMFHDDEDWADRAMATILD